MEELVEGLVEVVGEGVGEMFDTGSSGSSNSKDGRDWGSTLVAIFAITVIGFFKSDSLHPLKVFIN
mgnify:CR=1 FL=1|tara:strand:+ start:1970 stop:2167 length:198 start_codon:yes stop_codon:yes gene_type:complete